MNEVGLPNSVPSVIFRLSNFCPGDKGSGGGNVKHRMMERGRVRREKSRPPSALQCVLEEGWWKLECLGPRAKSRGPEACFLQQAWIAEVLCIGEESLRDLTLDKAVVILANTDVFLVHVTRF